MRRWLAVVCFLLLAFGSAAYGAAEDAPSGFAGAVLFTWIAVRAGFEHGRVPIFDHGMEAVGGVILIAFGIVVIADRANVLDMRRGFGIVYIFAPIAIVGGLVYGIRGLARLVRREGTADRN